MSLFLSIKAALTEPRFLDCMFKFNTTTGVYLSHLAAGRAETEKQTLDTIKYPLPGI